MNMDILVVLCIVFAVFLAIIAVVIYDKIVSLKLKVEQAESTIDVYLTQRFNLIPNLVECVKEYEIYEKSIFSEIIEKRSSYLKNKKIKEGEELDKELTNVIANVENYPELKANEQFLQLQKSLTKMENQLQAARRIYNQSVNEYNTTIKTIPSNIIATIFRFKEINYFDAENETKENINVRGI